MFKLIIKYSKQKKKKESMEKNLYWPLFELMDRNKKTKKAWLEHLPAKARILLNEELAISNLKFSSSTPG